MRVLIGPMARQAGRQGIQRLLEWAPPGLKNTNVVHCVENWPALLEAVRIGAEDRTDKYDILVAEFRLSGRSDSLPPGLHWLSLSVRGRETNALPIQSAVA